MSYSVCVYGKSILCCNCGNGLLQLNTVMNLLSSFQRYQLNDQKLKIKILLNSLKKLPGYVPICYDIALKQWIFYLQLQLQLKEF